MDYVVTGLVAANSVNSLLIVHRYVGFVVGFMVLLTLKFIPGDLLNSDYRKTVEILMGAANLGMTMKHVIDDGELRKKDSKITREISRHEEKSLESSSGDSELEKSVLEETDENSNEGDKDLKTVKGFDGESEV
jgi:hypothetical protein